MERGVTEGFGRTAWRRTAYERVSGAKLHASDHPDFKYGRLTCVCTVDASIHLGQPTTLRAAVGTMYMTVARSLMVSRRVI